MIAAFEEWRRELLELGAIVQDDDASVSAEDAGALFDRYVELVQMIDGTEGSAAVEALVSSMRSENDYGAYQATHGALALFSPGEFARGVAAAILQTHRNHSGEVLAAVARNDEGPREFNSYLTQAAPDLRAELGDLVRQEELDGWLSDEGLVGKLQPTA
jgi:hypothetical protein